jgi:hypothetical protein
MFSVAFGQTSTAIDLASQVRNPDFSRFSFTRPISVGSALPSTCQVGQLFFNTAAGAGANVLGCTQQNTWSVLGGYTLLPAGPNTIGGVIVPSNSALAVDSSGTLSVNVGTSPGTLAAGNDSRIVNALQPSSLIPAANISPGTLSVARLPAFSGDTISSAGSAATTTVKVNGTTVPVNSLANQVLLTTAAALTTWTGIPPCLDSGGQHLNFNTSTHAFSCGTSGVTGSGSSLSANNTFTGTNTFNNSVFVKGPIPWTDVTTWGTNLDNGSVDAT